MAKRSKSKSVNKSESSSTERQQCDAACQECGITTIAFGLIGPYPTAFEIGLTPAGAPAYSVDHIDVTREVYLDALATAKADRWYDGWDGEPIPTPGMPEVIYDAMKAKAN